MTIEELFSAMSDAPLIILLVFIFPPLYALSLRLMHGKGKGSLPPWRYFYSVLVYLSCIPGMFITVITAYLLFIQGENLIKLDLLVYIFPIVSMIATLILVKSQVPFADIPGFNRIGGLLLMLGGAFFIALIIDRLRIVVLFHGSIVWIFIIAGIIFAVIKLGAYRLFKKRKKEDPLV